MCGKPLLTYCWSYTHCHILFKNCFVLVNRSIVLSLQALGESLGKGDDHKDMDIITKFLKVCT